MPVLLPHLLIDPTNLSTLQHDGYLPDDSKTAQTDVVIRIGTPSRRSRIIHESQLTSPYAKPVSEEG